MWNEKTVEYDDGQQGTEFREDDYGQGEAEYEYATAEEDQDWIDGVRKHGLAEIEYDHDQPSPKRTHYNVSTSPFQ